MVHAVRAHVSFCRVLHYVVGGGVGGRVLYFSLKLPCKVVVGFSGTAHFLWPTEWVALSCSVG